MTFFDLILQTEASLHPDGDPDHFISEYTGFVRAEGDDGDVRRVGKVHAYRIHAGLAAAAGESLFEVCDAHSNEMHVLQTLLYEPNDYGFKQVLVDRFGAMDFDCLVLDYVVLHPRWRGLKLGLLAARKLIDLLGGGCGLVVSDIAPLSHEAPGLLEIPASWVPRNETREAEKQAARKLRRYFKKMGFERIGKTSYYGLSLTRVTPTLADLLKPHS
jgi:hypothetical protein